MKILVTGHRGFIGSHMVAALQADHEVTTFEWGDQFPGVFGLDWVIHMGAISSTTERDIDKIMRQNYEFSVMLYNECKTFGVNLQYSSSASVYGLGSDFKETSACDPKNPYAWSKYLFDRYVQQRVPAAIVQGFRYFNVYGSGEDHKGEQASPHTQFKNQAIASGKIKLFENSKNYLRDFVSVERVIEIHKQFLDINTSGVFNVGTGTAVSFHSVAEMICKTYGATIELVPMPRELEHSYQTYTCADLTLLTKTLNEPISTEL